MRFFFFDQKTEYECRISDWSSDVCSSDLDSGGAPVAISLDSVKIEDGTVIYRDATADIFEKVEDLDAEISAESLSGPFHARGEAVFQAVRASFDAGASRIGGGQPVPLSLTLGVQLGSASGRERVCRYV